MLHVDVDYEDGMGQGMFDLETVLSLEISASNTPGSSSHPARSNPPEIWLSLEKNQRTNTAHLV